MKELKHFILSINNSKFQYDTTEIEQLRTLVTDNIIVDESDSNIGTFDTIDNITIVWDDDTQETISEAVFYIAVFRLITLK